MGRARKTAAAETPGMLTVVQVAQRLGVDVGLVRWADRGGLLMHRTRGGDGHMRYTEDDLHNLRLALAARSVGIPRRLIRNLLDGWQRAADGTPPPLQAFLDERIHQITRRIEELQLLQARLEALRDATWPAEGP